MYATFTLAHNYDQIELPPIVPDVECTALRSGECPCCGAAFKAKATVDMSGVRPSGRT